MSRNEKVCLQLLESVSSYSLRGLLTHPHFACNIKDDNSDLRKREKAGRLSNVHDLQSRTVQFIVKTTDEKDRKAF